MLLMVVMTGFDILVPFIEMTRPKTTMTFLFAIIESTCSAYFFEVALSNYIFFRDEIFDY